LRLLNEKERALKGPLALKNQGLNLSEYRLSKLVEFEFEHGNQGCLVAPTLSIGSILLQQAAIQASFHYNNVEIVESRPTPRVSKCTTVIFAIVLNLRDVYFHIYLNLILVNPPTMHENSDKQLI